MRILILSLVMVAMFPPSLLAIPPEIKLTPDVPKPIPGCLVTVSADGTAKSIGWIVVGDCQYKPDSSGKSIVVVPKSGVVTVFAYGSNETGELSQPAKLVFDLTGAEPVKPEPVKPDPKKPDPPKPAGPVKIKAVVVYDPSQASGDLDAFFASKDVQERWKAKGHQPPLILASDVIDPTTGKTPEKAAPYIKRAAGKSLPQLYILNDATGEVLFEGPKPETDKQLLSILDKIGG